MKATSTFAQPMLIWLSIIALIGISSCKKEYEDYPYHTIEKFTVTDEVGNNLEAALVGDSIWIYWPPFQAVPDSISPVISISKNATISPASGAKVAFNTGTMYTVTSESGLSKTYYLKAAVNEPIVAITSNPRNISLGGVLSFRGQYFSTDTNRIAINLIDKDNHVIPLKLKPENLSSVFVEVPLPIDGSVLPDEAYSIQFISGTQTFLYGPFQSRARGSGLSSIGYKLDQEGTSIKRGATISFSYEASYLDKHYFNYKGDLQLYVLDEETNSQIPFNATLLSVTDTKLTYQIGEDAPLGKITTCIGYGQLVSNGASAVRFSVSYLTPYTTRIIE
ncbi:hypothetical protein RYH73_23375 [Olivibacter sp. CPCC 100613]|uniref:hypothetical protein n=1 Tax=Olivibacter sp. CPCC 100613 TaxID=3079931 RepID=UPI002FF69DA7